MEQNKNNRKVVYFAGGCFWGTEHYFKQIRGVLATEVGYANGHTEQPSYQDVCTDQTGFAEAVRVEYDSQVISLEKLLELFYKTIDPTTLNRQGNDIGSQYRTGIYFVDKADEKIIRSSLDALAKRLNRPMVVECVALQNYYSAEEYHQDYLDKNPGGYCHISHSLFEQARRAN